MAARVRGGAARQKTIIHWNFESYAYCFRCLGCLVFQSPFSALLIHKDRLLSKSRSCARCGTESSVPFSIDRRPGHPEFLHAAYSRMPCVAFQCFCRAGFYAARTATAEVSLYRRPTRKFNVGENGSQANPWSERARDKLAMAAYPAQPCSGCCSFVRKVSFDINHIGTIRSRQRFSSKTSDFDFGCQCY